MDNINSFSSIELEYPDTPALPNPVLKANFLKINKEFINFPIN